MALQHAKKVAREPRPVVIDDVCELHRLIFAAAWPDVAGQYRRVDIDAFAPIGDLPPPWGDVPGEMLSWGHDLEHRTATIEDYADAVAVALGEHMELVRIHPFQDRNGRTVRLLLNVILMRHVTGPTRPVDIPKTMKDRYTDCVQDWRQGGIDAFVSLILDVFDGMVEAASARDARHRR